LEATSATFDTGARNIHRPYLIKTDKKQPPWKLCH